LGDPDDPKSRVIKATRPEAHMGYGIAYGSFSQGATAGEYLDRIAIHNRIFNDDIHIERVVPHRGKLSIVTSQPFIRGVDAPQGEIDRYMEKLGFERLSTGTYYHADEGLLVHDLVPKNAKQDRAGNIYLIDPVIQRVTPDFADFMRKNPIFQ
jgi:hypothetical protein